MAEQAEIAFIKTFVNTISTQPVTYGDDYQQPPENSLSKVPVLQIQVPPAPERKEVEQSSSNESITLTFKSTKPAATFTLSVLPTDTIASIKSQLFESSLTSPHAPPADAQRLLLKGKALADNKLLKEYPIKAGDVVNLMVKPGFDWDPSIAPSAALAASNSKTIIQPNPLTPSSTEGNLGGGGKKHQRIPSVVLSPSPANDSPSPGLSGVNGPEPVPMDIELDIDDLHPEPASSGIIGHYHDVISDPLFWQKMWAFLRTEFSIESDSRTAWEEFLNASKEHLTPHEIAKIRDHVGLVGMAGT
ncbi:hypothetical protein L218DRAFT_909866 [Marasmius fiardii PR-910]|nr:hypothetical protein L218DRAFT_909866 [Marasmius fiardii PR-910]